MVAIECLRKNQVTPAATTMPLTPCPGDTVDVRNGKLAKDVLQIIWSLNPILATRAAALILHDSTRSDWVRQIGGDFLAGHGKAGWLLDHLHEHDLSESVLHGGNKVLERTAKQSLSQSGIDQLVRLARDKSPKVRRRTIELLADLADPRAVGELISSLNDVDPRVRNRAREILDGSGERCVRLNGFIRQLHGCSYDEILERIAANNRWAGKVGSELLGRPVQIENYRQGLGRTKRVKRDAPITIEVTDTPVTSGHPHGEDIVRGLILHEIGHHLCDFGAPGFRTTDGIARNVQEGQD